jgi:hypothetical protein
MIIFHLAERMRQWDYRCMTVHQCFRRRLFEAQVEATRFGEFEMYAPSWCDYKDLYDIAKIKAQEIARRWELLGLPYPDKKCTVEKELAAMIYETYSFLNPKDDERAKMTNEEEKMLEVERLSGINKALADAQERLAIEQKEISQATNDTDRFVIQRKIDKTSSDIRWHTAVRDWQTARINSLYT